jgi:thiol-disulfide isomerase/thioredoxin
VIAADRFLVNRRAMIPRRHLDSEKGQAMSSLKILPSRRWIAIVALVCVSPSAALPFLSASNAMPGSEPADEYIGTFETELEADRSDSERVIFKPVKNLSKIRLAKPLEATAQATEGRLYNAASNKSAIMALLVETNNSDPFIYADIDLNKVLDEAERFALEQDNNDSSIWHGTIRLPLKDSPFTGFPLVVRYFKDAKYDALKKGERLVIESRSSFARGYVDIGGKRTLVLYGYRPSSKKIDLKNGTLGVDGDNDGTINMDPLSPEVAEADEAAVFRVGDLYVSTKRADPEKNEIVMKSHSASDYQRIEVRMDGVMPDFEFTDFSGKKRRLSEYRGKYLLIDFWGMWCPPCRQELPFLKAAHDRFKSRGFEILGMNTDLTEMILQVNATLQRNGMTWPQAKRESIDRVIRGMRIRSYPTTVLLDPEGKVISLNNTRRGQPSLRGRGLLESLDGLLPH